MRYGFSAVKEKLTDASAGTFKPAIIAKGACPPIFQIRSNFDQLTNLQIQWKTEHSLLQGP